MMMDRQTDRHNPASGLARRAMGCALSADSRPIGSAPIIANVIVVIIPDGG